MSTQYDIFLCFSQNDSDIAADLRQMLIKAGLNCFMAEKDIPLRKQWVSQLRDTLRDSENVLLVITPHSINSRWVVEQIELAQALKKNVIPVLRFVRSEQLPDFISKLHPRGIETLEDSAARTWHGCSNDWVFRDPKALSSTVISHRLV